MTARKIDEIIIKNRAAFYKCSEDTFKEEGNTYCIRDWTDGCLYLTKHDNHTFISCGKALEKKLKSTGELITREYLESSVDGLVREESYPHYVYYGEKSPSFPLPEGYAMKEMSPDHHPPLQAFLDLCTPEDIDDAQIFLDDPDKIIHLVYKGDEPCAYAGYRIWEYGLGDVGILTRPGHRRKGIGAAAVAAATQSCLDCGDIPFYRTSRTNKGSQAIAKKVGYKFLWETWEYKVPLD